MKNKVKIIITISFILIIIIFLIGIYFKFFIEKYTCVVRSIGENGIIAEVPYTAKREGIEEIEETKSGQYYMFSDNNILIINKTKDKTSSSNIKVGDVICVINEEGINRNSAGLELKYLEKVRMVVILQRDETD
ncbi:MAG: hypothetical protein HFJ50_05455 [Clostridia bacterium]|nr:hypothetical protein [Clostridia bacterium]